MEIVIKAAALALIAAVCALLIKKSNPEISFAVAVIAAAVICAAAAPAIGEIKSFAQDIVGKTQISPAVFLPVIKCVGIALVVKLSGELCRDAGQSAAASALEYLGCAAALITALPLVRSMLGVLEGLI